MVIVHDLTSPADPALKKEGPLDLEMPCRSVQAQPAVVELPQDLHRTIRRRHPEHRGLSERLNPPQLFFMPAIDPFNRINREITEDEIKERLEHYDIPRPSSGCADFAVRPLEGPPGRGRGLQNGAERGGRHAGASRERRHDDPEGAMVYESLLNSREDRIIILTIKTPPW